MTKVVMMALGVSALAACSAGDTGETGDDGVTPEQLAAAKAAILATIADASCASAADCRTAAFGDKPCGGPWEYLAYCASGLDEAALLDAIADYGDLERQYNIEQELASTCAAIGDPGPDHIDGVCVLASTG